MATEPTPSMILHRLILLLARIVLIVLILVLAGILAGHLQN